MACESWNQVLKLKWDTGLKYPLARRNNLREALSPMKLKMKWTDLLAM